MKKLSALIFALAILTACTAGNTQPSETASVPSIAVTSAETTPREVSAPDNTDISYSETERLIRDYFGGYIAKNSEENSITAESTVCTDVAEEGGEFTVFTDSDGVVLRYKLTVYGSIGRAEMNYYIIDQNRAYFTQLNESYDAYPITKISIDVMKYGFSEYWLCDSKDYLIDNCGEKLIECGESPVSPKFSELIDENSQHTNTVVLSENIVDCGGAKIKVNVVMTSGEKKHIDAGYYSDDVYEGDFSLVSYSEDGNQLDRLEIKRFYPEEKNFFPAEKTPLALYDYGADGRYEFPICRYYTHNYSLCKLYSVDANGHFRSAYKSDHPIFLYNPEQKISLAPSKESDDSFSVRLNMTDDYTYLDSSTADEWFKTHDKIDLIEETYVIGNDGYFEFKTAVPIK